MARLDPPPGGLIPFDHVPQVWSAFNRFYGTLWSDGVVDEATKEVGRLRNARITGCGICKNLRFDGAVRDGLAESSVDQITDDYDESGLSDRWKLTIRLADALIADPASVRGALGDELAAEFEPDELVELVATITTAIAFSKAAVAFGAPEEMPLMVVPTPTIDGTV
jgi:alkylhydroperoxidase family enzyme